MFNCIMLGAIATIFDATPSVGFIGPQAKVHVSSYVWNLGTFHLPTIKKTY
jgi:hypothetical protein